MDEILEQLKICIERGKVDRNSPYPPDMKGQEGAAELTEKALEAGLSPQEILADSLMIGMKKIGDKFGCGEAFIPDLMISAKAMTAATNILKPHFESGDTPQKGIFVIGTVAGDMHDIGKNIVRMIMEGAGWKVMDLGTDVSTEKYLQALDENTPGAVGLSALLTTTMQNMEKTVKEIKTSHPKIKVVIGGAPVTQAFCDKIGADAYFQSPHNLPDYLEKAV
jgi:5-methyltetrahydrofolate--homocysteine methyltransferase